MTRPTDDDETPEARKRWQREEAEKREREAKEREAESALRVYRAVRKHGWFWPGED